MIAPRLAFCSTRIVVISLILLVIVFIQSFIAAAQPPALSWARDFEYPPGQNVHTVQLALDANGNVYHVGEFQGTVDFDPGPGVSQLTASAMEAAFVSKLDSSGNFLWVRELDGTGFVEATSVAIDLQGNIIVAGSFDGTADFDPGAGVHLLSHFSQVVNGDDAYVLKLTANGDFVWVSQLGGSGTTNSQAVSVDGADNLYVGGSLFGSIDFDPGPGNFLLGDCRSYICKLDAAGALVWAKTFGVATNSCEIMDVDVATDGSVYATGLFNGSFDFDPGPGTYTMTAAGGRDVFVFKLDPSGNFSWANPYGGQEGEYVFSSLLDASGNLFTAGAFSDTADFDPGPGTAVLQSATDFDGFVVKTNASGSFGWVKGFIGNGVDDAATSLTMDKLGNIFVGGCFEDTIDVNPDTGTHYLRSAGTLDLMIVMLDNNGSYLWSASMGSLGEESIWTMASDGNGGIYASGLYHDTVDFDPGPGVYNLESPVPDNRRFIMKLNIQTLSVQQLTQNGSSLIAYPNPTINTIIVTGQKPFKNATLTLLDLQGRVLTNWNGVSGKSFDVNLSGYPGGSYILMVDEPGGSRDHVRIEKL